MTILILIVLAAALIFAFGILIGQGLNGRTQIELDKSLAAARHELNDRLRALAVAAQWAAITPRKRGITRGSRAIWLRRTRANVMDL
jgi:hypothetical protein